MLPGPFHLAVYPSILDPKGGGGATKTCATHVLASSREGRVLPPYHNANRAGACRSYNLAIEPTIIKKTKRLLGD